MDVKITVDVNVIINVKTNINTNEIIINKKNIIIITIADITAIAKKKIL